MSTNTANGVPPAIESSAFATFVGLLLAPVIAQGLWRPLGHVLGAAGSAGPVTVGALSITLLIAALQRFRPGRGPNPQHRRRYAGRARCLGGLLPWPPRVADAPDRERRHRGVARLAAAPAPRDPERAPRAPPGARRALPAPLGSGARLSGPRERVHGRSVASGHAAGARREVSGDPQLPERLRAGQQPLQGGS